MCERECEQKKNTVNVIYKKRTATIKDIHMEYFKNSVAKNGNKANFQQNNCPFQKKKKKKLMLKILHILDMICEKV